MILFDLGWWPMLAPVKPGEIRDTSLLGVNQKIIRRISERNFC
jgi:hypothetical protein